MYRNFPPMAHPPTGNHQMTAYLQTDIISRLGLYQQIFQLTDTSALRRFWPPYSILWCSVAILMLPALHTVTSFHIWVKRKMKIQRNDWNIKIKAFFALAHCSRVKEQPLIRIKQSIFVVHRTSNRPIIRVLGGRTKWNRLCLLSKFSSLVLSLQLSYPFLLSYSSFIYSCLHFSIVSITSPIVFHSISD